MDRRTAVKGIGLGLLLEGCGTINKTLAQLFPDDFSDSEMQKATENVRDLDFESKVRLFAEQFGDGYYAGTLRSPKWEIVGTYEAKIGKGIIDTQRKYNDGKILPATYKK